MNEQLLLIKLESIAYIVLALWIIPLIAYIIDFWTGIEGAKAQGEKIYSGGLRRTISKAGDYWRVQMMALLIDAIGSLLPFYNIPYISMVATISIVAIEYFSVRENFKKKNSSKVIEVMDISAALIGEVKNAKDTSSAIMAITKVLNEHKRG